MIMSTSTGPRKTLALCLACLFAGLAPADVARADQAGQKTVITVTASPQTIRDPRIRYIPYGENTIYRLDLYLKSVSVVQFADDEQVESILIGDSASWEVIKLKNGHVISVKATIALATTNMTVYTDKRVYTFELHSLGEQSPIAGPTALRSVFTYPVQRKKVVTNPRPVQPERIDSSYMISGKTEFRPLWVQDNGRQTSFFLPENGPRPAIFKVGPDKSEQLINSRTAGSRIVVDGTADFWIMRIGDQSICIARERAVKQKSLVPSILGNRHAG
jgi:type IV secretion system protein VirB9